MGEGQVEEGWNEHTAEDVEVGKIALGYNDQTDQRAFNWAIESLAVAEEFQHSSWKMVL